MKELFITILITCLISACNSVQPDTVEELPVNGPIQLHRKNPHYFSYNGSTMALVTSAEHYGAVLNLDFDYRRYLEQLSSDGMNYTRIFTGTYFEIPGESFGIQNNTLAPDNNRVITPWAVVISDLTGDVRYDLSTWNEAYFERLKDFMNVASDQGIIVELTFFSSIYRDSHWDINPQNPANNINITHEIDRRNAHTLNNGTLLAFQEELVKKIAAELNDYDNLFFEIQNEPWSDRTVSVYNIINKEELQKGDWTNKSDFGDENSMAWQERIVSIIVEAEKRLPKKHLIAQNYTNFRAPIPEVNQNVSIINFHYAWPDAVEWNYHFNKVIGFDESGFAGSGDQVYRRQAWQFMLSGGGLFNNLDYSFFVGSEDGQGVNQAPGGGGKALRHQLKILSEFLHGFDLEKLYPNPGSITSSPGLIPYVLSDENKTYAAFIRSVGTVKTELQLETGDGNYKVQNLNTITGEMADPVKIKSVDGILHIDVEIPEGELALKIIRE